MPLKSGSSSKVISDNIAELHHGPNYAKTAAKHGKTVANKQAIAIAYSKARGRAFGGSVPGVGGMMMGGGPLAGVPSNLSALGAAMGPPAQNNGLAGFPGGMVAPVGVAGRAFGGGMDGAKGPHLNPDWVTRAEARNVTRGPILSAVPGRTDAHATHVPSGSYVIPADIVSGRGQGNTLAGAAHLNKLFHMGPYGVGASKVRMGSGFPRPKLGKFAKGGAPAHTGKPVRVNLAGGEIVVPPENLMHVVHPDLKTAHGIMDAWVLKERKKLRKTLAKLPGPVKE